MAVRLLNVTRDSCKNWLGHKLLSEMSLIVVTDWQLDLCHLELSRLYTYLRELPIWSREILTWLLQVDKARILTIRNATLFLGTALVGTHLSTRKQDISRGRRIS